MIYCYGDIWPENFILDLDHGLITIIDFGIVSILPSSFARYALQIRRFETDLEDFINIPSTDGVDNTGALWSAGACMVQGSSSFGPCGRRILGRPKPQIPKPSLDFW